MQSLPHNLQTSVEEIALQLAKYKENGQSLFVSSSFQSHSIPLLHVLSTVDKSIPVVFINTGFHFPETIRFRDEICAAFGLQLLNVTPFIPKSQQRNTDGNFYFTSDTDYCCFINKTQPMEPILERFDVWINGIRADQNANRRNMKIEAETPNGKLRYHPILNWTTKMIFEYASFYKLPKHPLEKKGYLSIGCEPCTQKFEFENRREGRWAGQKKSECGLHLDLVKK